MKRRPRRGAAIVVGATSAWMATLVLSACAEDDCIRTVYTITETRHALDATICGGTTPVVLGPPHVCEPHACAKVCPFLRLTDGTPIPPSNCQQMLAAGGGGGAGGTGGDGFNGSTGGGGGAAQNGGAGGAAGGRAPAPTSWVFSCEYDLDVDSCSSRSAARGEP